jgi:hypothetical protein
MKHLKHQKVKLISPKEKTEYTVASDGTGYVRIKGALRKLTPEQLRDIQIREAQGKTSPLPLS